MTYRRLPLETHPRGGFLFVLSLPDTNFVQYGLGFETANALTRRHLATDNLHYQTAYEVSAKMAIHKAVRLKLNDSLSQIFVSHDDAEYYDLRDEKAIKWLSEALIEVHDEAFGNPHAWEPNILSLGDGRVIWAMYDDEIEKIRLGVGFIGEENEAHLGDNSFMIGLDFALEFVTRVWQGKSLVFFSLPPRWPAFDNVVDNLKSLKEIAKLVLKLADKVWPGALDGMAGDEFDEDEFIEE